MKDKLFNIITHRQKWEKRVVVSVLLCSGKLDILYELQSKCENKGVNICIMQRGHYS